MPDRAGPVVIVGEIVSLFTKYPVQTNDRCADGVELGGQLAALSAVTVDKPHHGDELTGAEVRSSWLVNGAAILC